MGNKYEHLRGQKGPRQLERENARAAEAARLAQIANEEQQAWEQGRPSEVDPVTHEAEVAAAYDQVHGPVQEFGPVPDESPADRLARLAERRGIPVRRIGGQRVA